jgi:hypothetical protein
MTNPKISRKNPGLCTSGVHETGNFPENSGVRVRRGGYNG